MSVDVERVLRNEQTPNLNFRNMLSAHTTNRKDGPLSGSSLQRCFSTVQAEGGIVGHLNMPHSYSLGDCIALHAQSNLHPRTKDGEKKAFNEACLRALIALLTDAKDPSQVRLAPSNFRRGIDSIEEVLKVARAIENRSQPKVMPLVTDVQTDRKVCDVLEISIPRLCRVKYFFDSASVACTGDKYIRIQPGDLITMSEEDRIGWAYGYVHGEFGWFLRDYVEPGSDTDVVGVGQLCRARAFFDPESLGYTDGKYIKIEPGEQVMMSKEVGEGWAYGCKVDDGWFPRAYVELAMDSDLAETDDATQLTTVAVPRKISGRIPAIAKQIHEQERLALLCNRPFVTLTDGIEYALKHGKIQNAKAKELRQVNSCANQAKHCAYGEDGEESISPSDSASQVIACDATDSISQHLPSPLGMRSPSIISEASGKTDEPEHCFMADALFRTDGNSFVPARALKAGSRIIASSISSMIVDVLSVQLHVGEVCIVHLQTESARLIVTSSHRVPVQRGQSMQTVPARGLREGDLVSCSGGIMEPLVRIGISEQHAETAQIIFRPDVAVESFPPTTPAILSNGYRRQARQNHARHSRDVSNGFVTDEEISFPVSHAAEWEE